MDDYIEGYGFGLFIGMFLAVYMYAIAIAIFLVIAAIAAVIGLVYLIIKYRHEIIAFIMLVGKTIYSFFRWVYHGCTNMFCHIAKY